VQQRLVPFLGYEDAAAAIDWLCAAFGATENAEAHGRPRRAPLEFGERAAG
jgi:uncharacterized glyoxalase superfamily protein PhnB